MIVLQYCERIFPTYPALIQVDGFIVICMYVCMYVCVGELSKLPWAVCFLHQKVDHTSKQLYFYSIN